MLSELTSTKTHVQQLTTAVLFFGSCAWFALRQRRRRSPSSRKKVTFRIPLTSVDLSKEDVMELRQKRFATSVSVSYSNSGGVMMVGGKGSRLFDEKGNSYLDTRNNVAHCGHGHARVVRAVQQQVAKINTNTRYLHPSVALLADRLVQKLPHPLEVVFFVNSGSEANDLALRLARAHTRSKNTIVIQGAYHGHTIACLEVSPYKYTPGTELALELPTSGATIRTPGAHIWEVPCPNIYRGPHRDATTAGAMYANYVQDACHVYAEKRGEKVGAFLVEGGMSVAGVILPPAGYLAKSVAAVRQAGGVYIADEVQTGFGRLGTCFWAFQYHASRGDHVVVPDIVTVGKPFGNGMPLAAVVCTRDIANSFDAMGIEYFNTFGGNPVCAAAGLAVLDAIESDRLQDNADEVGYYLKARFLQLQKELEIIGDIRGSGLFIGIELVRNRATLEPAAAETSFICTVLKEKHFILTSIDGLHDNVLVVKPPMVFSKADADKFVSCFERVIRHDLPAANGVHNMKKTPT